MASDAMTGWRFGRSTRPPEPIAKVEPGKARLLRPLRGQRSMEDRVLGPADDVLGVVPAQNELAARFYDSICVIAHPLNPIPGQTESMQMLNTMESMSVARGMDDEQRTSFAEGMAAKVLEERRRG